MSLRATLGADFAQFSQALTTVELKLKESGDIAKNVGRDLSKMVEGFRGTDLMRQAELAAQGIDRIGGVSKLTEREQARVNATITEAIAKYRALGQEVPPHLQKIATETDKVGSTLGSTTSILDKIGPAMVSAFSVGAIAGFAREMLTAADAIVKMSDQTGISVGNVQRLQHLADQTSVSMGAMTGAVQNLQQRLGTGDVGANGALKALGINTARFLALDPYEQFMQLSEAIGSVENPTTKATLAAELFGKSWKELLPALKSGMRDVADGAPMMSGALVKMSDDAGDAFGRMVKTAKNSVAMLVMAGPMLVQAGQKFGDEIRQMWQGVEEAQDTATGGLVEQRVALQKWIEAATKAQKTGDAHAASYLTHVKEQIAADRAVEASKKQAEEAAYDAAAAWLATWRAVTQAGRDAATDVQASLKMVGGILVQVDPSTRSVGTQFEFLKWQIAGVRTTTQSFTGLMPALKGNLTQTGTAAADMGRSFRQNVGDAATVISELSRAAEMGGHNTTSALLSMGSAIAKGFAAGGPIGGAIAAASAAIGALAGKFSKTEGKKVNDLRDAFVSAAGGIDALNRKAIAAGTTLDALLKAKTVKDYEAAVAALNTKLEKTAEIQAKLAPLQQQLADRSVLNWQTAETAAGKYGITLEALGPQFAGAKLRDGFAGLWDDFQTLTDMGADTGAVLAGMSDEISGFVQRSMALGTEVPEQFRPLIAQLIASGQLLDANGKAITDMAGIKFGAPLVSQVDILVTAIDKLVAALTDHLIPTIGKIPSQIRVKVGYDYDPYAPAGGGGVQDPNADHGGTAQFAGGTHGQYVDFGAGTPVVLHGRERVVTETEGRSGGGGGTVILQINGRTLAELIVPALPGVIREYALG